MFDLDISACILVTLQKECGQQIAARPPVSWFYHGRPEFTEKNSHSRKCNRTNTNTYTCTYPYSYTYAHTNTYTNTNTNTYTNTYPCAIINFITFNTYNNNKL